MRLGAVTALGLALLAAGCAASHETASRIEIVPRGKSTTRIIGGSPRQRVVLRRILSGVGPSRVASIEIVTRDHDGWAVPRHGVGVRIATNRRDRYGLWQGERAGEIFARKSVELRLRRVAYIEDWDGGYATFMNNYRGTLRKPPLTETQAMIDLGHAVQKAKKGGVEVRARLLRPDRLAFSLVFRANDPADFLLNGLEPAVSWITSEDSERYDGLYVKVVDSHGKTVLESGAGLLLSGPAAGCARIQTGAHFERPPCPALYRGP